MRTSLLLLCTLAATASLRAQEYDVKFHRAHHVGDQCAFDASTHKVHAQKVDVNGKTAQQQDATIDAAIKGQLEITGVNKAGQPTQIKFQVDQWHMQANGKDNAELKAGDKIEGQGGSPGSFTINGTAASEEVTGTLQMFFDLKTEDAPPEIDDQVMGPGKKVKVGESWKINTEAAAGDLTKKFGSAVKPEMVKGTATLEAADGPPGAKILKLSGDVQVDVSGISLPGGPGLVAQKFLVVVKMTGNLPENADLPETGAEEEFSTEIEASNGADAPTPVKVSSKDQIKKSAKTDWKKGK